MANRSTFPTTVDSFLEHYDYLVTDITNINRWQLLRLKTTLTPSEQTELQNLTITLRNKMFTPEDFNKMQDCITNLEVFFRDNVDGYVLSKQGEMEDSKDTAILAMEDSKDAAILAMETSKSDAITQVQNKTTYFTGYVDTKEDEVRALVQDFDSNTSRYYTSWTATAGQIDFNIFQGSNVNIPSEANLNITPENIDVIVQGVTMKPYTDYEVLSNGSYDTIKFLGNAATQIGSGSEIVAKWYKNVGKLYFRHSSSHGYGGYDALTITETMLDSALTANLVKADGSIVMNNLTMGLRTGVCGINSSVLGSACEASGNFSHAEGYGTTASETNTHAEGGYTTASGKRSHAEGENTISSGDSSHAEGSSTVASGAFSHSQNSYTIAQGHAQTTIGRYNVAQGTSGSAVATDDAFIIGNGTSSARSNAFKVSFDGKAWSQEGFYVGASSYKVWHEGNDGIGTGLDADLLDGQEGSYYAKTSDVTANTANISAIMGVKTATIDTTWVGSYAPYTQTISVSGVTANDEPIICPVYSTTNATAISQKEAWNMVGKIITNNGSITVTCFESKPTVAIPIQIKGV